MTVLRTFDIVIRSRRGTGWHTVTTQTFGPILWPWLQSPGDVQITVQDGRPCPFCGDVHPPGPVGEPFSWLEGVELKVCPKVPEGFIYNDHEYRRGPRGQLLRLGEDD